MKRIPVIVELYVGAIDTAWFDPADGKYYWWETSEGTWGGTTKEIARFQTAAQMGYAFACIDYMQLLDPKYTKSYGWMDRDGVFHGCEYAEHTDTASAIVEYKGLKGDDWCEDKLLRLGYLRFTPISLTFYGKCLSEAQIDSLMKFVQARTEPMLDMFVESMSEILKKGCSKK